MKAVKKVWAAMPAIMQYAVMGVVAVLVVTVAYRMYMGISLVG